MSNDLSNALNPLNTKKATKINLMATISKNISTHIEQGYDELFTLMRNGSQTKRKHKKKILNHDYQVTPSGEQREKKWKRKRSSNK